MGALFECLNGDDKLACNFYYSTVGPDLQTGAGMPQRNPGLRPNFQEAHLLAARSGPRFAPRFLALLAGYENLAAPLFALSQ
jgi:hypothetical protein